MLIDHHGVIERFRGAMGGVEQSWEFTKAPKGHGDLVIAVHIAGGTFVGRNDRSLRFSSDGSHGISSYGVARWVDARGNSTLVRGEYEQGRVVHRVPGRVLEESTYPAVLDPIVGPEVEMGVPFFGPVPGGYAATAVGCSLSQCLVAWSDDRVRAVRVDRNGRLLDVEPIVLSRNNPSAQGQTLRIASDGADFLVVWDYDGPPSGLIHGTRVTAEGSVLDPGGITIGSRCARPSVAFDGANYLVVYTQETLSGSFNVVATMVGKNGSSAGTTVLTQTPSSYAQDTAVQFDESNYLVVWRAISDPSDAAQIEAVRVNPSGTAVESAPFVVDGQADEGTLDPPAIAIVGGNAVITWTHEFGAPTFETQIFGARVTKDDQILDLGGVAIGAPHGAEMFPTVASDGTNLLVAWRSAGGVMARRVSSSLRSIDPVPIPVPFDAEDASVLRPALAFTGDSYLLVAGQGGKGQSVGGMRIEVDGAVTSLPVLSIGPADQSLPFVASDGSDYLTVWSERRDLTSNAYGARVSAGGDIIGATFLISNPSNHPAGVFGVAFGRDAYAAVWASDGADGQADLWATTVGRDGTLLNPTAFPVVTSSNLQAIPDVAFDGTSYVVVWGDGRETDKGPGLYAARLTEDGSIDHVGGRRIASVPAGFSSRPRVACVSTDCLVVWTAIVEGQSILFGGVFSPLGEIANPSPLSAPPSGANQTEPAVATDGVGFLTVWQEVAPNRNTNVYGLRVDVHGVAVDGVQLPVSLSFSDSVEPAVTFDGASWWATWTQQGFHSNEAPAVHASRFDRNGALLDGKSVLVSPTPWGTRPTVAAGAAGRALVAYERLYTTSVSTRRVFARVLEAPVPPLPDAGVVATADAGTRDAGSVPLVEAGDRKNPEAPDATVKLSPSTDASDDGAAPVRDAAIARHDAGLDGSRPHRDGAVVKVSDAAVSDASAESGRPTVDEVEVRGGGACSCRIGARERRTTAPACLSASMLLLVGLRRRWRRDANV